MPAFPPCDGPPVALPLVLSAPTAPASAEPLDAADVAAPVVAAPPVDDPLLALPVLAAPLVLLPPVAAPDEAAPPVAAPLVELPLVASPPAPPVDVGVAVAEFPPAEPAPPVAAPLDARAGGSRACARAARGATCAAGTGCCTGVSCAPGASAAAIRVGVAGSAEVATGVAVPGAAVAAGGSATGCPAGSRVTGRSTCSAVAVPAAFPNCRRSSLRCQPRRRRRCRHWCAGPSGWRQSPPAAFAFPVSPLREEALPPSLPPPEWALAPDADDRRHRTRCARCCRRFRLLRRCRRRRPCCRRSTRRSPSCHRPRWTSCHRCSRRRRRRPCSRRAGRCRRSRRWRFHRSRCWSCWRLRRLPQRCRRRRSRRWRLPSHFELTRCSGPPLRPGMRTHELSRSQAARPGGPANAVGTTTTLAANAASAPSSHRVLEDTCMLLSSVEMGLARRAPKPPGGLSRLAPANQAAREQRFPPATQAPVRRAAPVQHRRVRTAGSARAPPRRRRSRSCGRLRSRRRVRRSRRSGRRANGRSTSLRPCASASTAARPARAGASSGTSPPPGRRTRVTRPSRKLRQAPAVPASGGRAVWSHGPWALPARASARPARARR